MEDRNTLIADCIVISCCCQCLILQFLVFVLLKLPRKLARKTRDFAKRKLRRYKGRNVSENSSTDMRSQCGSWDDEVMDMGFMEGFSGSLGLNTISGSNLNDCVYSYCCIVEVEKVLEEFSLKGEFAFGSFWGKDQTGSGFSDDADEKCMTGMQEVVQFRFIEVIGPLSCS